MLTSLQKFFADESAATAIEYAAIGAFLSILIVAATRVIGTKLSSSYYLPVANNLT